MVFQSYALFPHMTVMENVSYGLADAALTQGAAAATRRTRASSWSGLEGYDERLPSELSGGQQQRVAVRPRPGAGAAGAAVRRAAVQSRRQAAPPHARGDPRPAAEARPDLGLRHPRPGGGAGGLRQDRRDEQGPNRPGGYAGRSLRAARRLPSSPTSSAAPISSLARSCGARTKLPWCASAIPSYG